MAQTPNWTPSKSPSLDPGQKQTIAPAHNAGPPTATPEVPPPPYDAAKDPTWKQYLQHGGEAFRNFVNGLQDDERQMLHGVMTNIQNNPITQAFQQNPFAQATNALALPTATPSPGPQ